jgi:serine/threonine protein kinase
MVSTRRRKWPVLAQRYRLIRQIDAGGMGSVWLAEAVHLRSHVAVKIMDRSLAATPEAAARFLHEARTAASLRSPHVVQILDYGVHEGSPFIAMELLEGESLSARLKREGRLASWEQMELVLRHVARALGRAHDAGVIHRDLKPGNIFLVRDEEEELIKLLDFGIAKSTLSPLGAPLASDTRTGEFLGSPAYASPEQLQGSKAIDHRSDIWSFGVIAYECLLGRAPFAADSFVAMLLAICVGPLPVPSERGPVPAGFDAWFARVCARDVEQRFQSVREASAELKRLVDGARGTPEALAAAASHGAVERTRPPPPDGVAFAPPPDGAPRGDAPTSTTEAMPLAVAPSPLGWPGVDPPFPHRDTVPLVARKIGVRPRRRAKALTMMVALPAVIALAVFTLGASSSRAALGWRRLALSAGQPSAPQRDAPPERASDGPPPDARAHDVDAPPIVPTPPGELSLGLGSDPSRGAATSNELATSETRQPAQRRFPSTSGQAITSGTVRSRPQTARLTITASAPSLVSLDGVALGTTPLESIRIQPGNHEIVFLQNGRRSTETLTIRSGEHKRVEARTDSQPGDGLNEAAVKRTIGANRSAVVDACMDYAFRDLAPGDPTHVRVPVRISVEPSGIVRSVDTAAEPPGHPRLRRCVEERIAAWRFPGARADTVVNVAFVFVQP